MITNGDTRLDRKSYFETLYACDSDPWRYRECDYEIAKRADTLSFLRPHYASGCEVGCSIGVLTGDLAPRCEKLLAIDISPKAAALAREALAGFAGVEVTNLHLPYDRPDGKFDLLVLSEVLYFLDAEELARLAALARDMTSPGADVVIVNYDGPTQTRLTGREATDVFLSHCADGFDVLRFEQREHYHVRLLRRVS